MRGRSSPTVRPISGDADDDHQAEVDAVPAAGPGMDPAGIEAPWAVAVAGAACGSIGSVKVDWPDNGWSEPWRLAAGVSAGNAVKAGSAVKMTSPVSSTRVWGRSTPLVAATPTRLSRTSS